MTRNIDWKKAGWEAAGMLADLIRINTTNPPGNESLACSYLKPRYKEIGLETAVVESAPGRGSIIGRLRAPDPQGPPLLLLAHLDVVPAEPEGWTVPPFSGEMKDDYIYGRGALDCKNAVTAEWHALRLFQRAGLAPRRDVILAATADEEAGGKFGVPWILENRPELLAPGFCVNEGGGFGYSLGDKEIYFCQAAEKGVCWFSLTALGEPGHASVPRPDSAMDRMLEALAALKKMGSPISVSRTMKALVAGVATAMGGTVAPDKLGDNKIAALLDASARSEEMKRIFYALTRNTLSITMVHGGVKTNVIPARVEAAIDCRIVPGHDPQKLLADIRKVAAPFQVSVEPLHISAGVEVEPEGELYDALDAALRASRPNTSMVPFMVPGGTDGRFLAERGVKVYGFIPVLADPGGDVSVFRRAHGVNERVSIHDLAFAIRVLYEMLARFCV
ncbi:MAG TPA: M20/M25/M40 family metallo-hydrolase [bacterium]|nr:M20/M25/M40 family metallo-hydrolase [bacterium]